MLTLPNIPAASLKGETPVRSLMVVDDSSQDARTFFLVRNRLSSFQFRVGTDADVNLVPSSVSGCMQKYKISPPPPLQAANESIA